MQSIPSADNAFYHPDAEHIAHNRRGFWIAALFEIVGLLLFVGLFNLLFDRIGDGLDGFPLIFLGLLMSLVPAVLWLGFFYQMDRLEPEPKQKLIGVFVLGALVTAAIAIPFLKNFVAIDSWLYNSFASQLVGGILLVGFVQEAVVYFVVRYGILADPEFDERVDGVIYAIAAGLGMATVLNFNYVLDHGGVDLGIGSVRVVITALAHASFAGILGYFIGQARFEKTPPYYLPAGLTLAALLNGIFFLLEDRVTAAGLSVNPWNGLLLALVVSGVCLAAVFWLVNRSNEETLRVAAQQRQVDAAMQPSGMQPAQPAIPSPEPAPVLEANDDGSPDNSPSEKGEG
ncbi:MAG: PrsW family intramembrane metalloprotease [Caldilineaceae bacterium]|nr:PrsW family intramembrane metalloprotease [Caldilineaceae bacterium]